MGDGWHQDVTLERVQTLFMGKSSYLIYESFKETEKEKLVGEGWHQDVNVGEGAESFHG